MIKASLIVLDESVPGAERDAVKDALFAESRAQREACRCYNNLRARMGRMELASGNPKPRFYAGPLVCPSDLPIEGCDCGLRERNAAHLPAGPGNLDPDDGHRAQEPKDDGGKSGVADVHDDLHGQQ